MIGVESQLKESVFVIFDWSWLKWPFVLFLISTLKFIDDFASDYPK